MLLIYCITYLLTLSTCLSIIVPVEWEGWEDFKRKYKKEYENETEEAMRFGIFQSNMRYILKHNLKFKKGLTTVELGMNQYGDVTQEEFELKMLGVMRSNLTVEEEKGMAAEEPQGLGWLRRTGVRLVAGLKVLLRTVKNSLDELEESVLGGGGREEEVEEVNWMTKGAVTPAKDQGFCGSCWAFSVVGALESHIYIKTGILEPLSVQNLVDCTYGVEYDNEGCRGGIIDSSYQYIVNNKGIASEKDYPYETKDGECRYKGKTPAGFCQGYMEVYDEESLKLVLKNRGPVSVNMDASTIEMRFYKSGIYEGRWCKEGTNHALVLIGYGRTKGQDYWIIKNSWGPDWGENGLARIDMKMSCGLSRYGVFPFL